MTTPEKNSGSIEVCGAVSPGQPGQRSFLRQLKEKFASQTQKNEKPKPTIDLALLRDLIGEMPLPIEEILAVLNWQPRDTAIAQDLQMLVTQFRNCQEASQTGVESVLNGMLGQVVNGLVVVRDAGGRYMVLAVPGMEAVTRPQRVLEFAESPELPEPEAFDDVVAVSVAALPPATKFEQKDMDYLMSLIGQLRQGGSMMAGYLSECVAEYQAQGNDEMLHEAIQSASRSVRWMQGAIR